MIVVMVVGAGFAVGILSGMTGVGGGFLMTPLLMTIGVPSAIAVGTDSTQIAGTASSGALAHSRLGNVDVKLGATILAGSLIGGTVGVQVVKILSEMGNFDFWVRVVYVVMLGSVGGLMLRESVRTWIRSSRTRTIQNLVDEGFEDLKVKLVEEEKPKEKGGFRRLMARLPLQTEYKKAGIRVSALFPCGMGFGIGFLAAIMGVGGGFIMVPSMIYVLGMPTHVAVGTDLLQIVFTSTNVAFQQAIINHNVDILLAMILMIGAAIGAQIGARLSGRLEGHQLRTILGAIVVLVMVKLLFDLLMEPSSLFGVAPVSGGGH
ncbi:MAG: permease [Actinobacteria bacterium RBG_13_63_9]|nr:MAG: permease [Actinobacteria bacterium RBG_13_63_9]